MHVLRAVVFDFIVYCSGRLINVCGMINDLMSGS